MKILAIDTTTTRLCLGLQVEEKFFEYSLLTGRKLSQLLVPAVGRVLEAAGSKITDIDYFACGLGPGSFTGMRIGLATIKAFSVVEDKPVLGIPTLDILARNAPATDRLIIPVLDAKRSLVYCCAYKYERGRLQRKSPYLLLSPQDLAKKFPGKVTLLGDGAALYADLLLGRLKNAVILDKDYWFVQAHNLMELSLEKVKAKEFSSSLTVKPVYLYPKECQIKTR